MTTKKMQEEIMQNKKNKGFNTTCVKTDFLLMYTEVAEAYEAWLKQKDDFGEELADVVIYLMSIAEMNGLDLGEEVEKKMAKNKGRKYKEVNGVMRRIDENGEIV